MQSICASWDRKVNKVPLILIFALVAFTGWGAGRSYERSSHLQDVMNSSDFRSFQKFTQDIVDGKYDDPSASHDPETVEER